MIFFPFYKVRMKFKQVVPYARLLKVAKPGFKSSLLGSRDWAFYCSFLVLLKIVVITVVVMTALIDGSGDA